MLLLSLISKWYRLQRAFTVVSLGFKRKRQLGKIANRADNGLTVGGSADKVFAFVNRTSINSVFETEGYCQRMCEIKD